MITASDMIANRNLIQVIARMNTALEAVSPEDAHGFRSVILEGFDRYCQPMEYGDERSGWEFTVRRSPAVADATDLRAQAARIAQHFGRGAFDIDLSPEGASVRVKMTTFHIATSP